MNRLEEDVGDDLVVQIFDDGNPTGLAFFLQSKSVEKIDKLIKKKSPSALTYPVAVPDLLYWEGSTTPVVLMIWDVSNRSGFWCDVPALLEQLGRERPGWREKKTTTVRIPRSNTTDASGRSALRQRIADLVTPILVRGKDVVVRPSFEFPNDAEGQAAFRALTKMIEEGEPTRIDGKYIRSFQLSDWWERAHGKLAPEWVSFEPRPSKDPLPFQLQAVGPTGTESLTLRLLRVKSGTKKAVLSNEHEQAAITVTLTYMTGDEGSKASVTLSYRYPTDSVSETLTVIKFLIAAKEGGLVQLTTPSGAGRLASPWAPEENLESLRTWERLLVRLNYIQTRVRRFGTFSLAKFTAEDLPLIEEIFDACSKGFHDTLTSISMTLSARPEPPESQGEPVYLENPGGEWREVLGVSIPHGTIRFEFLDDKMLAAMATASESTEEQPRIEVVGSRVRCHYADWAPPNEGPALVQDTEEPTPASTSSVR